MDKQASTPSLSDSVPDSFYTSIDDAVRTEYPHFFDDNPPDHQLASMRGFEDRLLNWQPLPDDSPHSLSSLANDEHALALPNAFHNLDADLPLHEKFYYDPDTPSLTKAIRVYVQDQDNPSKQLPITYQLRATQYKLSERLHNITELGQGVYMMLRTSAYLALLLLLFGLISLIPWSFQFAALHGLNLPDWYRAYRPAYTPQDLPPLDPASIDVIITVLYAFAAWFILGGVMKRWASKRAKLFNNPSVFSIHADRLPENVSPAAIADYFSQWGPVVSVVTSQEECESLLAQRESLMKDYLRTHGYFQGLDCFSCSCLYRCCCARGSFQSKFDDCNLRLRSASHHSGHAFVTFRFVNDRQQCLKAFSSNILLRFFARFTYWLSRGHCSIGSVPHFNGHFIRVRRAPRFPDIIWENLHYGITTRFFRRSLSTFVALFIVTISFLLQLLVVVLSKEYYSREDVAKAAGGLYAISAFRSVVVVTMQTVLRVFLVKLSDFEHHWSHSGTANALLRTELWANFLNTSVNIAVINIIFPMVYNVDTADTVFGVSKGSVYQGLKHTPDWYTANGGAQTVLYVMFFQVFVPFLWAILLGPLGSSFVFCSTCSTGKRTPQSILDQTMRGPEPSIASTYASIGSSVFMVMTYGSSMPILYFLGAFTLLSRYWCEKYLMLRWYRNPKPIDDRLSLLFRKQLKWALLFHALMSPVFLRPSFLSSLADSINALDLRPFHDQLIAINRPAFVTNLQLIAVIGIFIVLVLLRSILQRLLARILGGILCVWCCVRSSHKRSEAFDTLAAERPIEEFALKEMYRHPVADKLQQLGIQLDYDIEFVSMELEQITADDDDDGHGVLDTVRDRVGSKINTLRDSRVVKGLTRLAVLQQTQADDADEDAENQLWLDRVDGSLSDAVANPFPESSDSSCIDHLDRTWTRWSTSIQDAWRIMTADDGELEQEQMLFAQAAAQDLHATQSGKL